MEKYSWSFREKEELFTYTADSIEECISEAIANADGEEKVYIGENVPRKVIMHIGAENIIDELDESVNDQVSWASDMGGWYNGVSNKDIELLEDMLNKTLEEWLDKTNNHPSYWEVVNVKEYTITI